MAFTDLLAIGDRAVRRFLGGTVTYTPGVGSPVDVSAIFEASYVRLEAGDAGVSTVGPAVFLRFEDLPSDPMVDLQAQITVGGKSYAAHEVKPDGVHGGVVLLLHEV